jgi:hypothetical protein
VSLNFVTGKLLDTDHPEFEISFRMLYQLAKERKDWPTCTKFQLTIDKVIDMLAKLERIHDVKDMTVIMCVDGIDNFGVIVTKDVLTALCSFLSSCRAFVVCVFGNGSQVSL